MSSPVVAGVRVRAEGGGAGVGVSVEVGISKVEELLVFLLLGNTMKTPMITPDMKITPTILLTTATTTTAVEVPASIRASNRLDE